jgi:type IV secretory pathway VirJ component
MAIRARTIAAIILSAILFPASSLAAGQDIVDAIFGDVEIFVPDGTPTGVVALLSDATGFGRSEASLAEAFRRRGDLVVGLSWPAWRRHWAPGHLGECEDLLGRIESVVSTVERKRGVAPYLTPVLAGVGLGGSATRALAPQAASHRIGGVVAVRSSAFVASERPICGTIAHRRADGFVYEAPRRGKLEEVEDGAEGAAADAAASLAAQAGPHGPGDLADLPLFVTAPATPPRRLAVVLTGDGGMGALDSDLANALAARATGVVTIDSRRYFWTERDPAAVAEDIQRIMRHFRHEWPIEHVVLVGYSFGADVLPLAYNKLSARARRDVAVVSLLAVAPASDLRVEFDDADYPNAIPTVPEASRMETPSLQCIYGEDDQAAAAACPAIAAARPGVEVRRTTGGHGFGGDTEKLADIIMAPLMSSGRR